MDTKLWHITFNIFTFLYEPSQGTIESSGMPSGLRLKNSTNLTAWKILSHEDNTNCTKM